MKNAPFIYKIDLNHRLLNDFTEIKSIVTYIIKLYLRKNKNYKEFNEDDLQISETDSYDLYLYIIKSKEKETDWTEFFPQELFKKSELTTQTLTVSLFIYTQESLYVIVGGTAYQMILPFIDHSLGMSIYSRILDSTKDEVISLKSRGVAGSISSSNNQYKDKFRLIDLYRFGSIPNEIHVKLCIETCFKYFKHLILKPNERFIMHAAKGVKIKKTINFHDLLFLIKQLDEILKLKESDFLLSYKELDKHSVEVNELNEILLDRIYNDIEYLNNNNLYNVLKFQYEFTNPNNTELFYEADYYVIKEKTEKEGYSEFKRVFDKSNIYNAVLNNGVERFGLYDEFNFKAYLKGVRIVCYKNDILSIASSFLFHFNTEIEYNGNQVFLIDTKWYRIRDSFINVLNSTCRELLQSFKMTEKMLFYNWDKKEIKKEGEYNLLYLNELNYLVLDTITVDGIELCDILYYDENSIYLIHVKYGFSGKMRELTNQIKTAAGRLKSDLQGNGEYLDKIFTHLEKKDRNKNLNNEEFIKLFKSRKIEFVLAYTDHKAIENIVADNIELYKSNIAKFSIIECNTDMNTNYHYRLNFIQIPRQIN